MILILFPGPIKLKIGEITMVEEFRDLGTV